MEEFTLTTPQRTYRGLQCLGSGSKKALALHGWLDNAASFQPLAEHLDLGELVALDMPGHGRSEPAAPGHWYHYVDLIWDVYNALVELDWERVVLMGHSMGATLSTLIAAAKPQLVSDLVLLDGLGPISTHEGDVVSQLQRGLARMSAYRPAKSRRVGTLEAAIETRMKASILSTQAAELLTRRGTRELDGELSWTADLRLRMPSLIRYSEDHVLEVLGAIEARSMLILAHSGPLKVRAGLGARIAALRGLQVMTLPGHHHVHMDAALACARLINPFLGVAESDQQNQTVNDHLDG